MKTYEDGLRAAFKAGAAFAGVDIEYHGVRPQAHEAWKRFRREWGDLPTVRDYADARMTRTQVLLTILERSGPGTATQPASIGGNAGDPPIPDNVLLRFDHVHYNGECLKDRFGECDA